MIHDLQPYPINQDSGLPWLGKIPSGWGTKRAKYFFREVDERSVSGNEELLSVSHKTGVTPRSQKNITMFMAESYVGHKVCQAGDLVINTMWAWMAALGVSRQTGIVSPAYGVYRLKASESFESKYLDHLLRTQGYAAEYRCRSTGVNDSRLRLYPESFLEIPILCPPKEEQAAIVRFLDHADRRIRRAIRAKRKLITLLNEQKQVVIHRAVTRGLDSTARLKRSGVDWLGDVPEHWEVRRIKTLCGMKSGEGITALSINEVGDFPVYGGNGIRGYTSHYTHDGDFALIGRQGALCGNVHTAHGKFWASEHAVVASLHQGHNLDWYTAILAVMNLNQYSIAAAQPGLAVERVLNLSIPVPPAQEQKEIVEHLAKETSEITAAIDHTHLEVSLLLELRTRLISDVVTGKLDVREAAAQLPAEELTAESADDIEAVLEDDGIPEDAESEEVEA